MVRRAAAGVHPIRRDAQLDPVTAARTDYGEHRSVLQGAAGEALASVRFWHTPTGVWRTPYPQLCSAQANFVAGHQQVNNGGEPSRVREIGKAQTNF